MDNVDRTLHVLKKIGCILGKFAVLYLAILLIERLLDALLGIRYEAMDAINYARIFSGIVVALWTLLMFLFYGDSGGWIYYYDSKRELPKPTKTIISLAFSLVELLIGAGGFLALHLLLDSIISLQYTEITLLGFLETNVLSLSRIGFVACFVVIGDWITTAYIILRWNCSGCGMGHTRYLLSSSNFNYTKDNEKETRKETSSENISYQKNIFSSTEYLGTVTTTREVEYNRDVFSHTHSVDTVCARCGRKKAYNTKVVDSYGEWKK